MTLSLPREGSQAVVAAVSGAVGFAVSAQTLSIAGSVAGQAIQTATPALVPLPDVGSDPGPGASAGLLLVVPLTAGGRTRGALTFGRTADRTPYTQNDLDLAVSFAAQAALALELADARELQARLSRLEDHDRIAADLHDHVIHELFAVGMGLQGLATISDQPAQLARIATYVDLLDKVIGTIRTTIFHLQPAAHDPTGLQARILDLAREPVAADVLASHRKDDLDRRTAPTGRGDGHLATEQLPARPRCP